MDKHILVFREKVGCLMSRILRFSIDFSLSVYFGDMAKGLCKREIYLLKIFMAAGKNAIEKPTYCFQRHCQLSALHGKDDYRKTTGIVPLMKKFFNQGCCPRLFDNFEVIYTFSPPVLSFLVYKLSEKYEKCLSQDPRVQGNIFKS